MKWGRELNYWLFLKMNPLTTISMKRSHRELSIDMVIVGISSNITSKRSSPVFPITYVSFYREKGPFTFIVVR